MCHNEWNLYSVNIFDLRKILQLFKNDMRYIYQTKSDTVYTYPIPTSKHAHDMYSYYDPYSEELILSGIYSSFIQWKEIFIAQINIREHSNEQLTACRTFLSCKHYDNLTAGSLAELRHIVPKRAKAKMIATKINGIRSSIIPLIRCYCSDQMYNLKRLQGCFSTDKLFANMK